MADSRHLHLQTVGRAPVHPRPPAPILFRVTLNRPRIELGAVKMKAMNSG